LLAAPPVIVYAGFPVSVYASPLILVNVKTNYTCPRLAATSTYSNAISCVDIDILQTVVVGPRQTSSVTSVPLPSSMS
jgi:hypothetical protein